MRPLARPLVCILLILLFMLVVAPRPAAAAEPAGPEIVVLTYLKDSQFAIQSRGYRVFYNKFETKFLPVPDYDFLANAEYDLMDALKSDTRARWRLARPEEKLDFAYLWDTKNPTVPPEFKGDALLLVFYSQYGVNMAKDPFLWSWVKLLNRNGKKMWQKRVFLSEKGDRKLEEWESEDPAKVKALLNDLQERSIDGIMREVGKQKVTP